MDNKARQERKKVAKSVKKSNKERAETKVYLTKKQFKFYKKLVEEKLEICGFSNSLLPYRTGVRKWRPKIVDQLDDYVLGDDGKPVKQPGIQQTPVEMITYRNIFDNMTKKILKQPLEDIEAFLALDDKEFQKAPPPPPPEKVGFFKRFFRRMKMKKPLPKPLVAQKG